jgi:hypothetical protein
MADRECMIKDAEERLRTQREALQRHFDAVTVNLKREAEEREAMHRDLYQQKQRECEALETAHLQYKHCSGWIVTSARGRSKS